MTATTTDDVQMTGRELRFLADAYEQAQKMRIETGERIRAVIQGRDETFVPEGRIVEDEDGEHLWVDVDGEAYGVEEVLEGIKAGWTYGPVKMLGRTFRVYAREEDRNRDDMIQALREHPAWPFLERVSGVGPTLACKLLARLDARKAPYCSSFWKYCGLATVPGERYRCGECGLVRGWPAGYNVSGKHQRLDGDGRCDGELEKVAGPDDGVRVAQPKPSKGEQASYDQYAKKVCWQIASSIVQVGGRANVDSPYERYYRREYAKAEDERPGWAKGRIEAKARRKMEKLLLSHLWEFWREQLGLDTPDPYIFEHGDGSHTYVGPEDFLAGEAI